MRMWNTNDLHYQKTKEILHGLDKNTTNLFHYLPTDFTDFYSIPHLIR